MIATRTISRTHSPSPPLAQSSSCSLSPDSPETAKTVYYRYIQYKTELLDLADRTMARSAAKNLKRLRYLVYVIVIRIIGCIRIRVKIGWRQGSLRVWGVCGADIGTSSKGQPLVQV